MNQIEIFYNPYRTTSRIVVGNSPVAEQDALAMYQKEPFHIWCDRIFDLIANEINDSFELTFHSTFVECEIIRVLGAKAPDCVGVKTADCTVNVPLHKRFDGFLQAQKSTAQYAVNLVIPSGDKQLLAAATAGMTAKGSAYEMHTPYHHCSVRVLASAASPAAGNPQTLAVWLSTNSGDWMHIPTGQSIGQPILFLCLNDQAKTGFREKQGDIYCYSCETAKIAKLLLYFLEFACIAPDFQQRITKLRLSPGYAASASPTLEALDCIDPLVRVSAPATVEVGQRYSLSVDVFPAGAPCPELIYQVVPDGIVECDKGMLRVIAPGSAQVTVYPKGGIETCCDFTVTAIARNRITQLRFPEPKLVIPLGDVRTLKPDFLPDDADNADRMQWKSSDTAVVKVKSDGRIKAFATGSCEVIASVEGVTASCRLTVQPVVQSITPSADSLRIHIGESAELKCSISPQNAYDSAINIRIEDPTIVSLQNGRVLPRCIGKTNVIFESAGGARAVCRVEVDSSFHAKQKGVSLVSIAVLLCLVSFFVPGLAGVALAAGGIACLVIGFLRGNRTITLFMIIVLVGCLLSEIYSLVQL